MGVRVRQKNGAWWVFIHHDGRRTSKKVGDKKAAEVVAAKIQAKLVLGDFKIEESISPPPVTFQDYAERWLESYARGLRQSTFEGYRRLLRMYAFPRFGVKPLLEVSREDVKSLVAAMGAKGLSKSSIRLVVAPIRELYNHAIDDGLQLQNPAARMGRFLKDKADRRLKITPLSAEEVQCLLEAAATCDQDRAESPYRDVVPALWLFLLCAVRTGLRLGEILGLQWGDIDYRGHFIEVRRGFSKRRLNLTKSGKIRRVDMSDQLSRAFQQAKEIHEAELAIEGREFDFEEPVFRNSAGHRLDESRVSKTILRRCLLQAGLRQIRFHDLRHTFASLLLANGESLVYVKDQLGHHSIQITVDTYGHLIPGSNRAAVNRLDTAPDRTPRAPVQRVVTPEFAEALEKESVGGGVWGSNPPTRY